MKRFHVLVLCTIVLCISLVPCQAWVIPASSFSNTVSLTILDDGSGNATDLLVDIPSYIPGSAQTPALAIRFSIEGTSGGAQRFYGDDPWEDWKNISLTGDVLTPLGPQNLWYSHTQGEWMAIVTPITPGGTLNFTINWPGNGTASQTLHVVNGTFVRSSPSTFLYLKDISTVITVTDVDGEPLKYCDVYAFRMNDSVEFAVNHGTNSVGHGKNGEYVFSLNASNEGGRPQNLVFAAHWPPDFWGYVKLEPTIAPVTVQLIRGKLANLSIDNGTISFKAVNIYTCAIPSLNTTQYTTHEKIIIHKIIIAFISQRYILGICRAAVIA